VTGAIGLQRASGPVNLLEKTETLYLANVSFASVGKAMPPLRLCLERLCSPRKDRPVSFNLPAISNAQRLPQAVISLLQAVAAGSVTPEEAGNVMCLIEGAGKAIEIGELEARIAAVEAAQTRAR
jgi:hypothetical protein